MLSFIIVKHETKQQRAFYVNDRLARYKESAMPSVACNLRFPVLWGSAWPTRRPLTNDLSPRLSVLSLSLIHISMY